MRPSYILLVAAAFLLSRCDAVSSTESKQIKFSTVPSMASGKNTRILRTINTQKEENAEDEDLDLDDDENLDSDDEERMILGWLKGFADKGNDVAAKLRGQGDEAATAIKYLQSRGTLSTSEKALEHAKKHPDKFLAYLKKNDPDLLKKKPVGFEYVIKSHELDGLSPIEQLNSLKKIDLSHGQTELNAIKWLQDKDMSRVNFFNQKISP